jgi:hypothetical protein
MIDGVGDGQQPQVANRVDVWLGWLGGLRGLGGSGNKCVGVGHLARGY